MAFEKSGTVNIIDDLFLCFYSGLIHSFKLFFCFMPPVLASADLDVDIGLLLHGRPCRVRTCRHFLKQAKKI